MVTIAQVSDPHIPPLGKLLRGIDAMQRFKKVVLDIIPYNPDFVVLTGDIAAEEGNESIYSWTKNILDEIKAEKLFIPGNHDDSTLMKKVFGIDYSVGSDELFYYKDVDYYRLVFLDTSNEIISRQQLDWLFELHRASVKDMILFVHHPLDLCECHHMDSNYPLKNTEEAKELIRECDKIKFIFAGHYHTVKKTAIYQATQYLTPSTAFQIYQKPKKFVMDDVNYGWRIIELEKNKLKTVVKYSK